MKKSMLAIALLTSLSAMAWAGDDIRIVQTTPEVMLKVGTSFADTQSGGQGEVNTFTITLQEKSCYQMQLCYNPSLMWMFGKERTVDGDLQINIGAGMDARYKFPKKLNNGIYVEAGPYIFIEPLHNPGASKFNFHAGVGVEYRRFIVSVDAYGRPESSKVNAPLYMVKAGYRF